MDSSKELDLYIGNRLVEIRKKYEYTQREISTYLTINLSTYKHYELGDRSVPTYFLGDLADFYQIDVSYFFDENYKKKNMESFIDSTRKENVARSVQLMRERRMDGKKYITILTPKEIRKYNDEREEKVQLLSRLRIKKYRIENHKTQDGVAKYLGIDISTYNKYEKGSRKLSIDTVKKLAEYYNITVNDIIR